MGVISLNPWIAALGMVALSVSAATNYTVLRSFGLLAEAGDDPDIIIEGVDDALYGAARIGSTFQWNASADNPPRGLIYKMQKDGSGYAILHRFNQTNQFVNELICDTNGVLYGVTSSGGTFDRGTIFRLRIDGTGFLVLHNFEGGTADGDSPCGLIKSTDGNLYGTTMFGGSSPNCPSGCGTAFKIKPDSSEYTVLRSFSGADGEGKHPMAGVVEGSDGQLYGTTRQGGAANAGTLFRINKDGSGYTTTLTFFGTNGSLPAAALLEGSDGLQYGTTQNGGTNGAGTFFKVSPNGANHQILHHFAGGTADGLTPSAAVVEGSDGAIYGLTRPPNNTGTIFKANKDGGGYRVIVTNFWFQRLTIGRDGVIYGSQFREVFRLLNNAEYQTIRPFTESGGEGTGPFVLIEGSDDLLYGLTIWGGKDDLGAGTVFKLAKDGSGYSILRYFTNDLYGGARPRSLIEASDGALYGGVGAGGSWGKGFLFKMNKDGSGFNVIVHFDGTNGGAPSEGLIEASDGALYGNAEIGGNVNRGVIFKLNKDGTGYVVLHAFGALGGSDAAYVPYGLVEGSDGWLYGESHIGGSASRGMLFKLRKDGRDYQELYNFADLPSSSSGPVGGLIESKTGDLFGSTISGGLADAGIIFKIKKDGTGYAPLLGFPSGTWFFRDAKRLMQASDGVFYGVTFGGVTLGQGTIFQINADGSDYSVLHDFTNFGGDGGAPWGGLIEGRDGALYGTTAWGGAMNVGTIFRYVPQPKLISLEHQVSGPIRITARALSGTLLAIEASTDLSTWTEIGAATVVNGRSSIEDAASGNQTHRFYRAVLR